ncbi:MAG: 1-acyl-sn-glycerol-3-phosphate acyltransferase [Acidobacteriales bacterium]|nr:1-acyl-sn-glycerol-3-phosphate acyltransferase [Terriglobales bacterium]
MALLRTLLAVLFLVIYVPAAALIAFPWTFLTGNADFLYKVGMVGARSAVRLAGIRIQIEGREQLDPAKTYVFMVNHVSNVDPPVVIPSLPHRTSVLAKKELFRIPVLGRAMKLGSLVPVDRSNRDAAIASMHEAAEVVRSGISMTIFPEGTRSYDGHLLPFKKGPFYLAMESGAPIVPVTILGTGEIMPKQSLVVRAGTARLVFHAPLDPADFSDRDALMAAVRQRIASALPVELQ